MNKIRKYANDNTARLYKLWKHFCNPETYVIYFKLCEYVGRGLFFIMDGEEPELG